MARYLIVIPDRHAEHDTYKAKRISLARKLAKKNFLHKGDRKYEKMGNENTTGYHYAGGDEDTLCR